MKAILAMAQNRVIGNAGKLPWRIPGDLAFFKKMTKGGTMVMGRKTFESLPLTMDLGDRSIIILSRDIEASKNYGVSKSSITVREYPTYLPKESWICGGLEIYRQLMPRCEELYVTKILKDYEGDTKMPPFEHLFEEESVVEINPEYVIYHYVLKK